jgi:hypothetical protein
MEGGERDVKLAIFDMEHWHAYVHDIWHRREGYQHPASSRIGNDIQGRFVLNVSTSTT